ncbi:MAG: DUF4003 family protein [Lachnospiraceae bacterium]|nr:DUF4003 family protein [Lachnospiraceae bacterium]
MTEKMIAKCELFAANKNLIHKKFVWDYNLMSVLSSLVYTSEDREADVEKMKKCLSVIKKNSGVFSPFRSSERLFLVSKMALSSDPEKYFADVKALYDKIRKGRFSKDTFMVIAAVNIVDAGRISEAETIIGKFNDLMARMKKEHPMLTANSDMPMVICLAMTDKSADEIIDEMEANYTALKTVFRGHSDSVQGLAEVLTLQDGTSAEKCRKVFDIYNAFGNAHRKYSKEYGLASLGALIGSSKAPEDLVSEICEAERYLAGKKGMGASVMGKSDRLMLAALLAADCEGISGNGMKNPIIVETIQTIIAMEMMMVVVATTAATSSSH